MKVIPVLSGKGGTGKSTIATNLAVAICKSGKKTGILDIDITGSNVPTMLGMKRTPIVPGKVNIEPMNYDGMNLKVMAVGFMTPTDDMPVMMKGEKRRSFVHQLLMNVNWGDVDYLVVDMPPGSGDEVIELLRLMKARITNAVIVTTPSRISLTDVRKTISLCKRLNIKVAGLVSNMDGMECSKCHEITRVYGTDNVEKASKDFGVPIVLTLPMSPDVEKNSLAMVQMFEPLAKKVTEWRLF